MSQNTPHASGEAYAAIRALITSGALPPGQNLSERGLSEQLQIGRTPVREAIKKLSREGLLISIPVRGTFVAQLSLADAREIYEIRLALEGMAARLAASRRGSAELTDLAAELRGLATAEQVDVHEAQRLGWQTHDAMFRATGNRRMMALYEDLRAQNGLALQRIDDYDPERTRSAINEHIALIEAMGKGDTAGAQELMWQHLQRSMEARMRFIARP